MLEAYVTGQELTVSGSLTADGASNYVLVEFTFDDVWERYVKTVIFRHPDSDKTVEVLLARGNPYCEGENKCYVPFEVLKVPEFTISVIGKLENSIATTDIVSVLVSESDALLFGEYPPEITPSTYDQVVGVISFVKEELENFLYSVGRGYLKGEKGDTGEKALRRHCGCH